MNDIATEVRDQFVAEHEQRKAELLSPAERRERAYIDREERLTDKLAVHDWCPTHYFIDDTITLDCAGACTATKTAEGWQWDERACPEHNPRGPIESYYDHGHWHAIRRDHYDGAPDSGINGCIGTSRHTRKAAIDELLDCEDAHVEMRAARRAAA